MNSLTAFEASARHLSFTRAAQELLISREAISRQIRILESFVGVKLFTRLYRSLELTEAGKTLQKTVTECLETIAVETESLHRESQNTKITVTGTIAITTFWIMPRLAAFREQFPEIDIRMNVSDSPRDLVRDGIDVGLMYGCGNWPGLKATHLFDVYSYPVCSKRYLESMPPMKDPADLVKGTLLNLDGTQHSQEDWAWWLGNFNQEIPEASHVLGFDSYANVIQAALGGQGIALGYTGIVDELVSRGRLVPVTGHSCNTGQAVHLVVPRSKQLSPSAQRFYNWIVAEIDAKSGKAKDGFTGAEYRIGW